MLIHCIEHSRLRVVLRMFELLLITSCNNDDSIGDAKITGASRSTIVEQYKNENSVRYNVVRLRDMYLLIGTNQIIAYEIFLLIVEAAFLCFRNK